MSVLATTGMKHTKSLMQAPKQTSASLCLSCMPSARTEAWWLSRHAEKQAEVDKATADIVFLGDSITHAWELEGEQAWERHFAAMNCINLGYAGDRTEHVLWRIENGELAFKKVDFVCLLIGTNNAGHRSDPAEEISQGIASIVARVQGALPTAKIILNAIFPRSRKPTQRMRLLVNETNTLIRRFCDGEQVYWLDINAQLLTKDGFLEANVMPDYLHPNAEQYKIWAQAICDRVAAIKEALD